MKITRRESPADIFSSLLFRLATAVATLAILPVAIVAMLLFDICDAIRDSRAWKWFTGRRH